ncbi:MAG: alpha-L-fucosidase [Ruminococcaceae bacterium]|nr:alpha-L-fucosidase [Oscillospiraceae bacterium]
MSSYVTKKTPGNTDWFVHDRFGMFIHWGLYAMPARHEWVKMREKMTTEQYSKYFKYFDPDMYDPKEWARLAKAAGMKYAVMTTRHHEGFSMFDTKFSDYKCTNTPAGRDLIREYVDAFRAEGLKIGFYYSLLDWYHEDYTLDRNHPQRDIPDGDAFNEGRDMHRYAQFMRNQVTELLTNYGKIDILWFDFSIPANPSDRPCWQAKTAPEWEAEELIKVARSLQPDIMIDNRAGIEQDLYTPEQYQPQAWVTHKVTGEKVVWEACQTFSGSWGYHRDESTWKSPEMLIQMLINTVAFGGNLLMNVGPTARGYLDERAENALGVYAKWMKYNSRSIYGCTMAEPEFTAPFGCRLTQTQDGKRLYIHLFDYPYKFLELPGYAGKVDYAQFLHDASELKIREKNPGHFGDGQSASDDLLVISLPEVKPNVIVPVIELFLK